MCSRNKLRSCLLLKTAGKGLGDWKLERTRCEVLKYALNPHILSRLRGTVFPKVVGAKGFTATIASHFWSLTDSTP